MKKLILALAMVLAAPVQADAPLRPDSFGQQGVITAGKGGPFYRLNMPLEVYQGVKRPDLGDLRVFNGRGEVVPYALLRAESQAQSRESEHAVPFFPLPAASGATGDDRTLSVTVRQTGDGTLVAVRQSPVAGKAVGAVRGVVIDASKLRDKTVRSLRLNVGPSSAPFHPYVLESSDDLQHWRLLKGDAQLVHLSHDGHQVVNERAEWQGNTDRYLRLTWADPQQAPAIRAVQLGVVETAPGEPVEIWSPPLAPNTAEGNVYDYALPGHMPLEKLRIDLPQINTLAPVNIQRLIPASPRRHHRHRTEAYWETVSRSVVYRLQAPQGEIRSPDIELFRPAETRLRLVADARAGGIGAEPPALRVGFVPHVLVFLARGEGPFVLAWGAEGISPGELPVSTLLPGYEGVHKLTATAATLVLAANGAASPSPAAKKEQEATSPASSKWILWSVMLIGLLVLGGMARTLLKQLRQAEKTEG
jgi:hypothetical protein